MTTILAGYAAKLRAALFVLTVIWAAGLSEISSGTPPIAALDAEAEALLGAIPNVPSSPESDAELANACRRVRAHGGLAASWSALGDALAQKQRDTLESLWYNHADAAYRRAVKIDPGYVAALTGLAWVFGGRHDFNESVRWAKLALQADPQNATAHGIIGDAALELGDLERAFECYQEMLNTKPDLASYSRGAWLLWLTGDSRKARWLMQKAIAAGGPHAENTAWCRARLAHMLFSEGALLPALQVAAAGLTACPDHVGLLVIQGRALVAAGRDAEATAAFEKVLGRRPDHDALVALGDLHAARGRAKEAEAQYEKVEALHAENVRKGEHDHTRMARFYADHGRCLDKARRLAAEHPQSGNLHDADTLAWVLYQCGDHAGARRAIPTALRPGTADAEIYYHAGLIAAATGDRPGAQRLLARALSLNPRFHPLHAPAAAKKLEELASTVAAKN